MTSAGGQDVPTLTAECPDDLQCGICMQPAVDATVTDRCGHLFCSACIARWLSTHTVAGPSDGPADATAARIGACPVDRQPLSQDGLRKDLRAQRRIGELPVRCPHEGCAWQGPWGDFSAHRNGQCTAAPPTPCPFAPFGCTAVEVPSATDAAVGHTPEGHARMLASTLQEVREVALRTVEGQARQLAGLQADVRLLQDAAAAAQKDRDRQQRAVLAEVRALHGHVADLLHGGAAGGGGSSVGVPSREGGVAASPKPLQWPVATMDTVASLRHTAAETYFRITRSRGAETTGVQPESVSGSRESSPTAGAGALADTATHTQAGWHNLVAFTAPLAAAAAVASGASTAITAGFHVRILTPADGSPLNPSTVMVGVTGDAGAGLVAGAHLGGIAHSACLQGNGFVWGGQGGSAMGAGFGVGDTVGVMFSPEDTAAPGAATGACRVGFTVNGTYLGDVPASPSGAAPLLVRPPLYAAISMLSSGATAQLLPLQP